MFWQIIAENKRKSVILIALMGISLAVLGYSAGIFAVGYLNPAADGFISHRSGLSGIIIAVIIWLILLITALFASDSIFLSASNAKQLTHNMNPQLFNVVEEMVIAAAMPKMPEIYIIEDMAPNAFALGKGPDDGKICVTAGLLAVCGRDELQGVVAHELSHIINRDVLYMTIAATMLGAVSLISDTFLRSFRYLPSRRYSCGKSSRGKGQALIMLAAFTVMILGPLLSRILYFSISRKREYLADATSARLTRYPEGLASALEKIMLSGYKNSEAPKAAAPFYIANPYRMDIKNSVFATHPPITDRIQILRSMTFGASYTDYLKAYWKITGTHRNLIPVKSINIGEKIAIRKSSEMPPDSPDQYVSRKKAGDIIRHINGFKFIECPCKMNIKVPPETSAESLICPRCSRVHKL